ncbi:hypothetical protein Avbf_11327 [Armadillidium vulgare]|nr:hypothetical protein Avbf_11327 [Armadillidium vulgare]
MDAEGDINIKDKLSKKTDDGINNEHSFQQESGSEEIQEEVMEENGQGHGQILVKGLDGSQEEIMENGQGQDQGQGFDQSSGLDESQVGIEILNGYLTFLMNLFQLLLQHFQLMYCENICLFIDLK